MSYLSLSGARVVETPAATMRTYASPTTSTAAALAVWRTEMSAGSAGPVHVVDRDQVVVVISGELRAEVDGQELVVAAGDGAMLPGGAERRLAAGPGDLVTVTASLPGATARIAAADAVPVPWAR